MANDALSGAITLLYTHGILTGRERDAARRRLSTVKQSLTVGPTCNDSLQVQPSVAFLLKAARYFEGRPTGGEDAAHWANVYNAKNCRRAADLLRNLQAQLRAPTPDRNPEGHDREAGPGAKQGLVRSMRAGCPKGRPE